MASEFEILVEGFHFDKWANNRWLQYLDEKGLGAPDREIFRHMLSAQDLWHERCLGVEVTKMPHVEVDEPTIQQLNARWLKLLMAHEDDPVFHFKRLDGEQQHQRLSRIARHVLDHGTYHRGELRGLCRARGHEDFPETGLYLFHTEFDLTD